MLWPFSGFHPIAGLAVVALMVSVATLQVVRVTSNQTALAAVKRQIHAALFELRLFNDDPGTILRATGRILRENANYLRLVSIPVLWLTIPLLALLIHLQFYYGYDGLAENASTVIKVRLEPSIVPRSALMHPPSHSRRLPVSELTRHSSGFHLTAKQLRV